MPYIDLYGRNPDPRATFGYPSTVMPLPRGPKLFVQLPAAANRIFGKPSQKMVMEEETRVQLDPTSIFEYTERNHGLGGLGGPGAPAGPDKPVRGFLQDFREMADNNPGMLYFGLGCLTIALLGGFKVLGRLGS